MRVEVTKPPAESEDYQALAAVAGTDADIDVRIDAITDLAAAREELRRLARAVRTLAR
jgi:hypothetical protein